MARRPTRPRPVPLGPGPDVSAAFQRRLVTPEGLDLRLTLASAGERATAFLIDAAIQIACLVVLTIASIASLGAMGADSREAVEMIWLLGAFALRNGYFILFEIGPRSATPGKRIIGLRVIARDGGALTAEAILTRNALREIEIFLPLMLLGASAFAGDPVDALVGLMGLLWSGIFLVFPLFNRDRLRVGDLLAGTWVVRAPRVRLQADMAREGEALAARFAFTQDQASAYGVKELQLLEEVLRRRDARTMAVVAERIRNRIVFRQPAGETDQAFLAAYYGALRARLEHRLLFGHRRADKFDTA